MPMEFPYRTRRTIKPSQMDPRRRPELATLREILEDAHWAPTHGLTQPWRFQVFLEAARGRLADGLERWYDRLTPPAERRADKRAKLRANALGAPVVIAVAARVEPGGRISELDELLATASAVQNLLLSAHQRGLGSFWSSAPVAGAPEFLAWLGLDGTHRGLGLVYLGYPREGDEAARTRLPLDERVTFHHT